MALKVTDPIIVEQINVWTVRELRLIMREPPEAPSMVIALATGYDNGEGIVWGRETYIEVPPEDVVTAWSQPISDSSIYGAVKSSIYAWLMAHGYVPDNAIET